MTLLANPVQGAFVSTEQISEGGAIVGTDANAGLVPGQSGALLWPADLHRPDGDHRHDRRDRREGRPDGD